MLPPKVILEATFCLFVFYPECFVAWGGEDTQVQCLDNPNITHLVSLLMWFTFQAESFLCLHFLHFTIIFNASFVVIVTATFHINASCLLHFLKNHFLSLLAANPDMPAHMLSSLLFFSSLFLCVCLNSQWQN